MSLHSAVWAAHHFFLIGYLDATVKDLGVGSGTAGD
jgi:hypothetical protein